MMLGIWLIAGFIFAFGFVVFFGAPYVPSRKKHLTLAFDELYPLGEQDTLLDLGAGDGVVVRTAAERGAHAVGYELNPLLVLIGIVLGGRHSRASMKLANIWTKPFPASTTVVYIFGDGRDIKRLSGRIQNEATRLKKPLSVISYGFLLPGFTPVRHTSVHHLYEIKPLQYKKPQV